MYYSDGDSEGSEDTYGEDERVIEELTPFLSNSTCACGGTVLVGKKADQCQDNITEPVVIRWDAGNLTKRLTLPLPPVTAEKSGDATLQGLIDDMEPASFGFQGKDIVDDSYRKAVKLDTSAFTTNFCPYKVGIVDTLGHALLPIRKAPFQGIYADLYKLNVSRIVLMGTTAIANLAMYIYEGPSGIFKPHVDTPRSELQFGSLVVCLPSAHKGGQLVVRHQGYSTVFDWANNSPNIQWAAFYGDCKHEVKQVVSGHRVTLTYNLYWRRGVGEMCGFNTTLNIKELPAYREMVKALSNPLFFAEG
jgi:hypothetical protein